MSPNQDWYDNKELFEMIEKFTNEVSGLKIEMAQTKTLIRDYNGLRRVVNEVDKKIDTLETKVKTTQTDKRDYIGWIFALFATTIAIAQFFVK